MTTAKVLRSLLMVACGLIAQSSNASTILLEPEEGVPLLSRNKTEPRLTREMIESFHQIHGCLKDGDGLQVSASCGPREYVSRFSLPDQSFAILCIASITAGEIQVVAGNIRFSIVPGRVQIYESERLKKTIETQELLGVAFERGYGLDNRLESIARVYDDQNGAVGAIVALNLPAPITVRISPNTVGKIGPWEWVRGQK